MKSFFFFAEINLCEEVFRIIFYNKNSFFKDIFFIISYNFFINYFLFFTYEIQLQKYV